VVKWQKEKAPSSKGRELHCSRGTTPVSRARLAPARLTGSDSRTGPPPVNAGGRARLTPDGLLPQVRARRAYLRDHLPDGSCAGLHLTRLSAAAAAVRTYPIIDQELCSYTKL